MHALQTEEFTIRSEVLSSPTILRHATTNVGACTMPHFRDQTVTDP